MLNALASHMVDVKLVGVLCSAAEQRARDMGQSSPGSEHFTIAAFELPDGSADRVFRRLNIDRNAYRVAIDTGYREALAVVGLIVSEPEASKLTPPIDGKPDGVYRAQPCARSMRSGSPLGNWPTRPVPSQPI